MKTIKQLEKEISALRIEQNKIEEQEYQKIQVPFLKSLDGKCFVYRDNGYGGDTANWDVFRKVVEVYISKKTKSVYLICEEFSVDCYGKVEWKTEYHFPYTNEAWRLQIPFSGYVDITDKEYEAEKLEMINQMSFRSEIKKQIESNK